MEKHTCQVDDCIAVIPIAWVMCRRHWQMLPRPMRDALWSEYLVSVELGPAPVFTVRRDALEFIAERESLR
jgi:hypothetical protein